MTKTSKKDTLNLIGISGKINSGKDTVGKILQYLSSEEYSNGNYSYASFLVDKDSPYQIKKFADKLKDIVCLLIGCTREQLEDGEFKDKPLGKEWDDSHGINTPRELLQVLGTDCGRDIIHPNIWVNALFADFEDNKSGWLSGINSNWVVTDVRFPNEAQAIKDRGGIVIRVNRPFEIRVQHSGREDDFTIEMFDPNNEKHVTFKKGYDLNNHPSETALDDYEFDHVIDNNGSIEELIEKVKQLKLV